MSARKRIATTLAALLAIAAPAVIAAPVHAQDIRGAICSGINLDVSDTNCYEEDGIETINGVIRGVINLFSLVVGVVSVIMIMVGGFKYITSGGDSSSVSAAKNTILYAIIGLVIVVMAQWIVRFILSRFQPV